MLQIRRGNKDNLGRRGNKDNLGILFHISPRKPLLWPLIRTTQIKEKLGLTSRLLLRSLLLAWSLKAFFSQLGTKQCCKYSHFIFCSVFILVFLFCLYSYVYFIVLFLLLLFLLSNLCNLWLAEARHMYSFSSIVACISKICTGVSG